MVYLLYLYLSFNCISEDGVSLQITFDPWNMSGHPEIKFFGPLRLTDKFLKNLTENAENWDPNYDIIQNILRLLGIFTFF